MKNQLSVLTTFFIENMPFNIGISLFHFQLKSIIDARRLYLQWYPLQHPAGTEVQFPLKEIDIKSILCVPLQSWAHLFKDNKQHIPRTLHVGKCSSQ